MSLYLDKKFQYVQEGLASANIYFYIKCKQTGMFASHVYVSQICQLVC